jgi:hypothetical protein
MKVFMSWSGLRSKAVAELIANWAKCVVQATQPWISTSGIDRGAVWFSAINDELTNTSVGIICLTHENKNKPWILFEAGALAKGLVNSRVCTFLIDLTPTDLESPLSQFNHTTPDEEGLWNLARTLNSSVAAPLDAPILEQVFDIHWPVFQAKFAEILKDYPQDVVPEVRSEASMMAELLENSRSINNRLRAVEERTFPGPRPAKRVAAVSELPKLHEVRGRYFSEEELIVTGATAAKEMLQSGLAPHAVQNRLLQGGFNQQAIDLIFRRIDILIDEDLTNGLTVSQIHPG